MNIVIPLFIYKDCIELRYALRSLRNLSNVDEVFIVSDRLPEWTQNVHLIQKSDMFGEHWKECNIFGKLLLAANVVTDFLYMNDDHYILQPFDASAFPIHHKGQLTSSNRLLSDPYRQTISNTLQLYKTTMNYDSHCPMNMTAEGVKRIAAPFIDWKKPYGYCMKTLYINANNLQGEYCHDWKIQHSADIPTGLPYFSTHNRAMDSKMINRFENKFPGKSCYEK